jgi:RHS repeat-associated protein
MFYKILELDDQNNQVATNTYGLSIIKRTTDKEGYYLYNGHGDVKKIVDNTNNILNSYVYDEFGKILQENETFNNPYKYAGYYYDKETKTYYLQARYYDPEIQRFISEDTYRGNIDDPLSLNLYTYCSNNPMIYTDPSGHFFKEIVDGVKYIGERSAAILDAGGELLFDSVIGLGNLGYSIVETGISEVGLISNYVGNKVGLFGQEQYKTNKEKFMSTITENGQMYLNLPKNMINGIKDNFSQTFNFENFKNYWNPNTSYNALKDYSKSVIQTGTTVYGAYKISEFAFKKFKQVYSGTQVDKFGNVKTDVVDDINNSKEYTKSNLMNGQKMHKTYKSDVADGITRIKEYELPSGKRIDFVDLDEKIIYELKPYNPRSIKLGYKQLNNYLKEVENLGLGNGWKIKLDVY